MATSESDNDDARPERSANQLRSHRSSVLEKVLEYRFLADLSAELLKRGMEFDVLRGDVDHQGYDLVVEANSVVRHIQLKAMVNGGKRADVTVNVKLADKPSGCVVWMRYDPDTLAIGPFAWFGGDAGEPLPDIGSSVARHTKGNAQGLKAERPNHRVVPVKRFDMIEDIAALIERLFGAGNHQQMLRTHLREVAGHYPETVIAAHCPDRLTWENSAELAQLIDGFGLARRAELGDPYTLTEARLAQARETGSWPGDLLELWVTMCIEHRRWRQASPYGPDEETHALLCKLCEQFRQALVDAGYLTKNEYVNVNG